MNKEYKDIEIKAFAVNILKFLALGLALALLVCVCLFFYKLNRIDFNDEVMKKIQTISIEKKELMLDIEKPSVYTNFDVSVKKLTHLNMQISDLIKTLENKSKITKAQSQDLLNSLDVLKKYITEFNSILGVSFSDFKSFNVVYSQVKLMEVKQTILEFIFTNNVDLTLLNNYLKEIDSLIEKKDLDLNNNNNIMKELYKDKNSAYKVNELIKINNIIDDEKMFLLLSKKLLLGIKQLKLHKERIVNYSDFQDAVDTIQKDITNDTIKLKDTKEQLILVCIITFFSFIFVVVIIFKFGYELNYLLQILYKTFLNSPIQQILIYKKNNITSADFINDNFNFNSFALTEQSENVRKTQAINFYDSLNDIIESGDNKGFDYGTLVEENHNKIQLYDENSVANKRETRYFSVFRKHVTDDYELINKVDVTKKILQIRDYRTKLYNMQTKLDTDSLTGLLSLQALQDRELKNDRANKNNIFLYLKIDNFNDFRLNYSTIIIDEIIKVFANSLKNALNIKDNDESLKKTNIYHLQIDEFCIVYKNQDEAIQAAELIQKHFVVNSSSVDNFSIGRKNKFGLKVGSGVELKDLELNIGISSDRDIRKTNQETINRLAQAILASYETIKTKEPYCIYKEGLNIEKQHAEQQKVISHIRHALDNDKIFIVCQGVHNSLTRETDYYEVLVRMRGENNEIIYPSTFLDVARKVGLYKDIQEVVINKVFDLIDTYPNEKFSINLANSDITNKETSKLFKQRLEKCPRPDALCVEILESESIDKYDELSHFLELISFYGCKIAIDDFGSGYSNFYRLLKIKFDYLKIDGSIIESLIVDENARTVLETLVGFAHRQGYEVVAEFVKNKEILKIVQDYGIEKAQGYELSKPEEPHNIFV